ncbi:MAG: alanine racemase [Lachnospiraceae bacterium]|nr:alanine racemase [Lachnospiraceae bacterium]
MLSDHIVPERLAAVCGTPSYVFSERLFSERAALVQEAFGPGVDICFSIKANPFLLSILQESFARVEVCSPGELRICRKLGIAPEKIVFSGVNKEYRDVEAALEYGCGVITAESPKHFDLIVRCAAELGIKANVLLRLTGGSQFGMDESILTDLIRKRDESAGVRITGIHYFTGTQKRKAAKIAKEIDEFEAFLARLEAETGYVPEEIEYGAGLAVDFFDKDPEEAEKVRLMEIAPRIREFGAVPGRRLTVEMGRFFAAPCGFYLTRAVDIKRNCGVGYAILDGGLHQLKYDGQLAGMQIPGITHLKPEPEGGFAKAVLPAESGGQAEDNYTLCGSLCTTMDVLARNVCLPGLSEGDVLVFHETGAYSVSEGMAAFLSRDLPAVWLLREDGSLVRAREKAETFSWNCPSGEES